MTICWPEPYLPVAISSSVAASPACGTLRGGNVLISLYPIGWAKRHMRHPRLAGARPRAGHRAGPPCVLVPGEREAEREREGSSFAQNPAEREREREREHAGMPIQPMEHVKLRHVEEPFSYQGAWMFFVFMGQSHMPGKSGPPPCKASSRGCRLMP